MIGFDIEKNIKNVTLTFLLEDSKGIMKLKISFTSSIHPLMDLKPLILCWRNTCHIASFIFCCLFVKPIC